MPAMTTHIALLRAINLAGHNKVAMADLRQLLAGLGFADVRSVLQSGNLVFESDARPVASLESLLEESAKAHLGLETDFFVRTTREWRTIVSGNPFPQEAERDPAHLVVMFLKDAPDRDHAVALEDAITGREVFRVKKNHAYIVYPDGIGRSRLTNDLIEKKLGTRGTARNWNTMLKLLSLAENG
jgi:uncharacterized protein (DUF1697 family)